MAEVFTYFELWSGLQAAGGARLGQFLPVAPRRRLRLTGDDALQFAVPATNHLVASFVKGAVVREVLSLDGATWREWPIDRVRRASSEVLVPVECIGVLTTLVNYPITSADADGFVTSETGALQLPPSAIMADYLLGNAPAFWEVGTVTPTDNAEVPFSRDSALSGGRRLEEAVPGYEVWAAPDGTTAYDLNFTVRGAAAASLYLRTGKQLRALTNDELPGQITRVNQIAGADGDDGPSGVAWAYWEVTATTGAGPYLVTLAAIHGGAGPIAFDDQLNHAGLPGGANSLYVEKADGTFIQITDSIASTQQVEVSSLTGISTGDWVRIVASSTGLHLTSLDAPTELAAHGVLAGRYEAGWDDTVCVLKNSLQEAWASTLPDNWTGLGAKTTTDGEWITSGAALHIDQSVGDGAQIAAPPARNWFIRTRRTTYSAMAWIRLLAAHGAGSITFRIKVGSTVVGSIEYVSPTNAWRQLKIEGLDLSAYAGTTVALTAEIVKSGGTGTVDMLVDAICLTPSLAVRAPTTGSNAARTWQGVNAFMDVRRTQQVGYRVSMVDLDRLGRANQQPVVLGGMAVIDDEVTVRVLEIEDAPDDPGDATITLSTVPPRFTRAPSRPVGLVVPFFEPIAVRAADRATRNAAILLKAEVTDSDATTVEVTLTMQDSLGGVPTISYEVFGASYVSGSGVGPYVFTKPVAAAGVGRVVFTASLPGRNEVYDAVDVPEQAGTGPSLDARAQPGSPNYNIIWSGDGVELAIDSGAYGTPPASPITVARNAAGGAVKEYTFRGSKDGVTVTNTLTIPPIDANTVTADLAVTAGTMSATQVAFAVSAVNPLTLGNVNNLKALIKNSTGSGSTTGALSDGADTSLALAGETVTVNRPAFGAAAATVRFVAEITGGGKETILITIPQQDRTDFGPNLEVTVSPGATSYDVHYTAEGGATLTYAIDNGTFSALGSSPLAVARNSAGGADKNVTIRAVHEGITQSSPVTVPAQAAGGGTVPPSLDAVWQTGAQNNATNTVEISWTASNVPAGATYTLDWRTTVEGGDSGSITGVTSAYDFDFGSYGLLDLVAKGTSGYATALLSVTLRMLDGSTTVASKDAALVVYYLP